MLARRPVMLAILDGWGVAPASKTNSITVADTPNMDRVGNEGRLGVAVNTPAQLPAGSDVATMSLLGLGLVGLLARRRRK